MEAFCKMIRNIGGLGFVFIFGGFSYGALEILWRGYTHPTMLLLGGICLVMIYLSEKRGVIHLPSYQRAVVYASMITLLEFFSGMALNVGLGLEIWDYSPLPFNLFGQICVLFSLIWFILSFVCIYLCKALLLFLEA